MTVKKSLSLILISTIFFWLILAFFIFVVDPQEAGIFGLIIFFFSLFFSLLGILTLLFIILKFRTLKNSDEIFEKFSTGFRQATLFSFFLISLILLRFFKFLEWQTLVASFLFFFLLELIFSAHKLRKSLR